MILPHRRQTNDISIKIYENSLNVTIVEWWQKQILFWQVGLRRHFNYLLFWWIFISFFIFKINLLVNMCFMITLILEEQMCSGGWWRKAALRARVERDPTTFSSPHFSDEQVCPLWRYMLYVDFCSLLVSFIDTSCCCWLSCMFSFLGRADVPSLK